MNNNADLGSVGPRRLELCGFGVLNIILLYMRNFDNKLNAALQNKMYNIDKEMNATLKTLKANMN